MNPTSRSLTYLLATLYALLGAWLFLDADVSANFAWKVSPFQAMTIGGWCLGNAWLAFTSVRRWRWPLVSASLVYLWLFGILESLVLVAFSGLMALAAPVAWLYVATLGLNGVLAIAGGLWLIGQKDKAREPESGRPIPPLPVWGFLLFASFLGIYGVLAPPDGLALNAGIFPEVLGAFTLRAFGVFYLSLGLGTAMLLVKPTDLNRGLHDAYSAVGIIIFISIAFIVHWSRFDLAAHPFQWLYPGAYFAVGIPLFVAMLRHGTGMRIR